MKEKTTVLVVGNRNGNGRAVKSSAIESMKSLMEQSSEGMVVIDAQSVVLYANAAAESFLRSRKHDLIGRLFPHPFSHEGLSLLKVSHNGDGEKRAQVRVGKIVWGSRPAYVVVIKDLTPVSESLQREISERCRLDGLKDQLVASVSHEIRSPLTVIQAAVESLKRGLGGPLTQGQASLVRMADRSTSRLLRLAENLLELSRLESGRMAVIVRKVDAARLIREVNDGLRLVAGPTGAAIREELPDRLPPLNTDPNLFVELLHNLIENAQRFAKAEVIVRAVVPDLEACASPPPAPRLHLTVIDDGPGIDADRIKGLFDKNSQLAHSRAQGEYRGSGLGLAICKELVEALHGRIWVESVPGQGAQFHVLLPCNGGLCD